MKYFIRINFALIMFISYLSIKAQGTITNLGFISVDSGTTIVTAMDLVDSNTISNHKNSTWQFNGSSLQTIKTTGSLKFGNLYIDNPFHVSLDSHISIDSQLNFINGKLLLNNFNCNFLANAAIKNYGNSNYFVTNGLGSLVQNIPAMASVFYPVGTITDYLPFTFANNGTADIYSIRTQDSSYLKYDSTNGLGLKKAVTTLAVNKTWIINETQAGGANFDLNLQWNGSEELPGFNRNMAEIRYYNYSDSSWQTASNYLAATGTNPYSITKTINGITFLKNFPVGVFTVGAPLPVQWLSFDAAKKENTIVLNWKTTNSVHNENFEIQRSENGNAFETIGKVNANTLQTYNYYDLNTVTQFQNKNLSNAYYRLKQNNLDGKYSFSSIKKVSISIVSSALNLYPNPATDFVNISFENDKNEKAEIQIIDASGKVMSKQNTGIVKGFNNISVGINGLAKGSYTVVVMRIRRIETIKFVK